MSTTRARNIILTGAVAAITATGAWYGAGLKTRQEISQTRQSIQQNPISSKITQLELTRDRYIAQKAELQAKIDRLAEGKGPNDDGKVIQGR